MVYTLLGLRVNACVGFFAWFCIDFMIVNEYQYKRQSPICPVLKHGPRSLLYVRVIK